MAARRLEAASSEISHAYKLTHTAVHVYNGIHISLHVFTKIINVKLHSFVFRLFALDTKISP